MNKNKLLALPAMALLAALMLTECTKDETIVPTPITTSNSTVHTDSIVHVDTTNSFGPEAGGLGFVHKDTTSHNYGPEDAGHSIGYDGP